MSMQTPELHLRANASYQVSCEPWSGRAAMQKLPAVVPLSMEGRACPRRDYCHTCKRIHALAARVCIRSFG